MLPKRKIAWYVYCHDSFSIDAWPGGNQCLNQCLLDGPLVTPRAAAVLHLKSSLYPIICCSCLVFSSLNFDHGENSSRSFELRNVLNAKYLATGSVNRNRTNVPVVIIAQATIRVYSHVCAGARLALPWPNDLRENSDTHLGNRTCECEQVIAKYKVA